MLQTVTGSSQAHLVGQPKQALDTPAFLIDLPALDRNIARIAETCRSAGVNWRPHTKGLKSPPLAERLLAAGAFGITCAKTSEAEVMAEAGIQDILIANQVVGQPKIARLLRVRSLADPIVAVDSVENVQELNVTALGAGVILRVVVEVDTGMHRAGTAPGEPAVDLARFVERECPGLRFVGVMGWEGHATRLADDKQQRIVDAVGLLVQTAEACRAVGLPVEIVSCGGTGTYSITARQPGVTEIQAGGGVLTDIQYRENMGVAEHEHAATILATVTSRPTPTRIICDAGKKTMSSDAAVPRPILAMAVRSVGLSAEHAKIELESPSIEPRIGDKIEFIVGYTDTTVHLHEELYAVQDGRVEAVWPVAGRGKLR